MHLFVSNRIRNQPVSLMQIDEILDDFPTTPDEQTDLIIGLIERIEHWNAGIRRHRLLDEPDRLSIQEFTHRRDKYVGQLAVVLNRYGLIVLPGTVPLNPPYESQQRKE